MSFTMTVPMSPFSCPSSHCILHQFPQDASIRFLTKSYANKCPRDSPSKTLWKHLGEIDEECNEMMDRLVGQMAKKEGVTEQLKSDDWLCWLQKINSIRSRAEEVVLHDLIYSL